MRKIGLLCVAIVLLGLIPHSPAWARGGHHGGGFGWGLGLGLLGGYGLGYGLGYGFFGRPYYPYYGYPPAYGYGGYGAYGGYGGYGGYGYAPYGYAPAYAYPPVVSVPSAPVIVQQQPQVIQAPQPPAPEVNYWYYCRKPEGYYPYVKKCPGGWLQVAPQPAQ